MTLAQLIESRDNYTSSHSRGVEELAVAIGKQLGCSNEMLEDISIPAILHDIGKIGVSEHILNKPDKLTEAEFEIIKQHTVIGYNALKKIDQLEKVEQYILHHHEKYNGKGYPAGKAGVDHYVPGQRNAF